MNLIPKLAESIGVELGEEFKVITPANIEKRCRFYERGDGKIYLEKFNVAFNQWTQENTDEIGRIVTGNYEVKRLPFEPKVGEYICFVIVSEEAHPIVDKRRWSNCTFDLMAKACGNVFRTEAEAEAHKYEIYERLTGRKWEEE